MSRRRKKGAVMLLPEVCEKRGHCWHDRDGRPTLFERETKLRVSSQCCGCGAQRWRRFEEHEFLREGGL